MNKKQGSPHWGTIVLFADSGKSILILNIPKSDGSGSTYPGISVDFKGKLVQLKSVLKKKKAIIYQILKALPDYPDVKKILLKLENWNGFTTQAIQILDELESLYLRKYLVQL